MKKPAKKFFSSVGYASIAFIVTAMSLPIHAILGSGLPDLPYPTVPVPANSNFSVGAYYKNISNYGQDFQPLRMYNLRADVAASGLLRKPMLGYYTGGQPITLDWQIKWALEHGLNYFIFEESWNHFQSEPVEDESVRAFLSSRYGSQMNFALKINRINVPGLLPSQHMGLAKNKLVGDIATYYNQNYLNKPNYLKIDNKPVIVITNQTLSIINEYSKAEILDALNAFEVAVGKDIMWVLSDPNIPLADGENFLQANNQDFQNYKEAGIDVLYPEFLSPVTNGIMDRDSETGTDYFNGYTGFIDQEYRDNIKYMQRARDNGLKMILNAPVNFDQRPQEMYGYNDAYNDAGDGVGFTLNQSVSSYEMLLNQIKDLTTAVSFLNVTANGKPMIGVGSWNDWTTDNHIEPGWSAINANSNLGQFDVIRAVGRTFVNNFVNPTYDLQSIPNLRVQWITNQTNFHGADHLMKTTRNSSGYSSGTEPTSHNNGEYISFVSVLRAPTIQLATNLDINGISSITVPYSAVCSSNGMNQCFDEIVVSTYQNTCAGEIRGACPDTSAYGAYKNTIHFDKANCVNKPDDATWGYCTIPLSFEPTSSTTNRLEQVDISFMPAVLPNGVEPTYVNVADITLQ